MYNAIFGTSTRKEVLEAQQEIFNNEEISKSLYNALVKYNLETTDKL